MVYILLTMAKATALLAVLFAWCYNDYEIFYKTTCILIGTASAISITVRGL